MCTAITYKTKDYYFGRNLDLDCSYGEEVCVMPRNYPLFFRKVKELKHHYAMIGMATIVNEIPLFYDATNEFGLSMAGLNFPKNAYYYQCVEGKDNIAPFEFIPFVLGKCKNIYEVKYLLEKINLVNIPFSDKLPLSPLHWIISDKDQSLVVETMKDGMHIYDNSIGVLTNNPSFNYQIFNLNNYRNLKIDNGENTFSKDLKLENYCQGLGAIGLPGDVSSMSRFVRMVFNKSNSVSNDDEKSSVSQFFHLLSSVSMTRGSCLTENNHYDITVYTSCVNTTQGLYYYTTYDNHQITCINMYNTNLESNIISRFPLVLNEQIKYQN